MQAKLASIQILMWRVWYHRSILESTLLHGQMVDNLRVDLKSIRTFFVILSLDLNQVDPLTKFNFLNLGIQGSRTKWE